MDLHDAFFRAVKSYYDGFDYGASKSLYGEDFSYDHGSLDTLHQELVKKKKPAKEVSEDEVELEDALGE